MYELEDVEGDARALLMVASDRISTYDVVHPTPIPDKGKVLTGLSVFWFEQTAGIVANHLISTIDGVPEEARGRALVVRRLKMLPVECVVRGYITGSGWKDYQATGSVSGIALPQGLRESERLPEPIFTPEHQGRAVGHDEAIDFERAVDAGRRPRADGARQRRLARAVLVRRRARARARRDPRRHQVRVRPGRSDRARARREPTLVLGDEVLTPDSSRYWPADGYEVGRAQPSFDKQYVRDWAVSERLGQAAARAGDPRRTSSRARARATWRPTSCITGEPFQAWLDRTGGAD